MSTSVPRLLLCAGLDAELGAAVADLLGAGVVVFWVTSETGPS